MKQLERESDLFSDYNKHWQQQQRLWKSNFSNTLTTHIRISAKSGRLDSFRMQMFFGMKNDTFLGRYTLLIVELLHV